MKTNNVDQVVQKDDFVDAHEAAELLGVKLQTLYAYTSRGLIQSVAGASGRARRYSRADIERLKSRSDARPGHGSSGVSRWGETTFESMLTVVDAQGPRYRGRSAVSLAEEGVSFEAVAELLWTGQLPEQAAVWPKPLFDSKVLGALLPEDASPLTLLTLLLPTMAARDPERFAAPKEAEFVRAKWLINTMVASLCPLTKVVLKPSGKGANRGKVRIAPGLTMTLATLLGHPSQEAADLLNKALILSVDHEMNASTLAVRVTASAGADLYACLGAALAAVSGPLQGGACDRVEALVSDVGKAERARSVITERVRRGEGIPGFGHSMYPEGDPRATVLLRGIEKFSSKNPSLRTLLAIIKAMEDSERGRPTMDVALVALGLALGAGSGFAAGLFVVGRSVGWIAHLLEQRERGGLFQSYLSSMGMIQP